MFRAFDSHKGCCVRAWHSAQHLASITPCETKHNERPPACITPVKNAQQLILHTSGVKISLSGLIGAAIKHVRLMHCMCHKLFRRRAARSTPAHQHHLLVRQPFFTQGCGSVCNPLPCKAYFFAALKVKTMGDYLYKPEDVDENIHRWTSALQYGNAADTSGVERFDLRVCSCANCTPGGINTRRCSKAVELALHGALQWRVAGGGVGRERERSAVNDF